VALPGTKPQAFTSCCVAVQNIQRILYVAPKPGVDIAEVAQELDQIRQNHKIKSLMSKPVKRTFSFDEDGVERQENATFLKVIYSAKGILRTMYILTDIRACFGQRHLWQDFCSYIWNSNFLVGAFSAQVEIDGALLADHQEFSAL
jgi:hypothetical protein